MLDAVHLDPALGDENLAGPPRADARRRQDFL